MPIIEEMKKNLRKLALTLKAMKKIGIKRKKNLKKQQEKKKKERGEI